MTKRRKYITLGVTVGIIIKILLIGVLMFFYIYNPFLGKRLVKYYSNDNIFFRYRAIISELDGKLGSFYLSSIIKVDNSEQYKTRKNLLARVFSNDIEYTIGLLNPSVGKEIDFVGTLEIFFDGCPAAIVSLFENGNEILKYEDGKSALIEWASHVH